ncbi:XRE family transcriptional regulator [Oscillibacter sp. MSJ-2]|uniref:XRE family transcriptional regulator n=1 Tax=Dysosmobacter acutus TaxID=2841504 RepID=A0ABS6FAZ3_9FIRM|nr:XRE family transcriptional regulator [Dysosmobacter acutus]MBU5626515.1 XRE family transcriptional regulator [Dysosmobacter acutus]
MSFGERLKEYREARGYTQEQLAEIIGVAKTTITGYERGNRAPDVKKIKRLAKALGITGDELLDTGLGQNETPLYSSGAMKIAKDYDALDVWGKQALRELADTERQRMEAEARFLDDTEEPVAKAPKVIPLYLFPAAAGYAAPAFGTDFIPLALEKNDPQGADFAVRIQGDSMEPVITDGSKVFCNHDPLSDGDIGIFSVDGGEIVCKQYHYDSALGMTYLFSINRDRSDADVVITSSGGQNLVCLGRVIVKGRYPLPGEW